MKECAICHKKRTFWERTPIHTYTIGMSFDYGAHVLLCDNCRNLYDNWQIISRLGWQ
jgi:hypothetical protein